MTSSPTHVIVADRPDGLTRPGVSRSPNLLLPNPPRGASGQQPRRSTVQIIRLK
jgi:hypothetical protein